MGLHEELNAYRDYIDRNRENKARLAQVFAHTNTTGQGTFTFPDTIEFGLTFIEEPNMMYGCFIDQDAWEDQLEHDEEADDTLALPSTSGFVCDWIQDEKGFHIGAAVGVCVWFPVYDPLATEPIVPIDSQPAIKHYFTFAGIAMKDVPLDVDD
jgi:hypothetical protein